MPDYEFGLIMLAAGFLLGAIFGIPFGIAVARSEEEERKHPWEK